LGSWERDQDEEHVGRIDAISKGVLSAGLQVVGRRRDTSAQLRVRCGALVAIRDPEVSRPQ
jgi:hypothetical protein